jgi:WD40 repeat protein
MAIQFLGVSATFLLLGSATLPLLPARALEPPASAKDGPPASTKPFPSTEAGMHSAPIRRIAVDGSGRWAVTASHDKTARIWNLDSGKLERVLRVPVGDGHEGKLYAVALSPDGALVALGGFTGSAGGQISIYLFERASGRMIQRLTGLPNVVNYLSFSADGRLLAAALGGNNGIRVYGADGFGFWTEVAADRDYGDSSYSVDFDSAGRLLASSQDGKLRLYAAGSRGRLIPLVLRATPGGNKPFFARFSPNGRRVAVGFHDSTAVALLDGTNLQPLAQTDTSTIDNGSLNSVAWSPDGLRLLAAGTYDLGDGSRPLVVWPAGGGAPQRLPLGMTNTVMDLRPLADGRVVYGGGGPSWGMLDRQLQRTSLFWGPPVLDLRHNPGGDIGPGGIQSFRLAPDGRWIEFRGVTRTAAGARSRLVRFDLAERRLSLQRAPDPNGQSPRISGLPIGGWDESSSPTFAGQLLPLEPNELSLSLAISGDGSRFALGSEWAVRLFRADGSEQWRASSPSVAWLVNLSPDGRFVVAALGDGTIRWYRTRTEGAAAAGSQALALYVHPDLKRWILWTPEGFYDASPGGASLFGYHLNNGRNAAGTFISSAQLEEKFFRPDLVAKRLGGSLEEEQSIARAVAEVGDVRTNLSVATLPPDLRLLGQPKLMPNGEMEITYELIDKGGGIGSVELRINGVVIEGRANPPVRGINKRRILLPSGKQRAQLVALSHRGVASAPLEFDVEGAPNGEVPTLHLMAVGITNYRDGSLRQGVKFAASDARAFIETLTTPGRAATPRVAPPVLLTEDQATVPRIRQELKAMASRVQPADVFVLYLAGHGVSNDQGEYVFLPQDLLYQGNSSLQGGLDGPELRNLLKHIPSTKTVVVLDTCSSGTFRLVGPVGRSLAEKGAIDRFARRTGRVVLAAAGDRKMALESQDNKQGIYTGALLKGINGQADTNRDGVVGVGEVADFVDGEVQRITLSLFGYLQTPMREMSGQTFPLSRSGVR